MAKPGTLNHLSRTYQAESYPSVTEEFETKAEAVALIESIGHGSVITWHIENNLPYCLPERVHKSLALDVFDNGKWKEVNIF